jgi:hypothetical protein
MANNDFLRRTAQRAQGGPPAGGQEPPAMVCWEMGSWKFFPIVPLQGFILGYQTVEVDPEEEDDPIPGAPATEKWPAITLLTINGVQLDLDEADSKAFLEQVSSIFQAPSVRPATLDEIPGGGFLG